MAESNEHDVARATYQTRRGQGQPQHRFESHDFLFPRDTYPTCYQDGVVQAERSLPPHLAEDAQPEEEGRRASEGPYCYVELGSIIVGLGHFVPGEFSCMPGPAEKRCATLRSEKADECAVVLNSRFPGKPATWQPTWCGGI
jgi:hypothetical protein